MPSAPLLLKIVPEFLAVLEYEGSVVDISSGGNFRGTTRFASGLDGFPQKILVIGSAP